MTKDTNKGLAFSKVIAWRVSFQNLGPVQCPVCTLSYFLSLNWPGLWSAWCIPLLCIRLSIGITHIQKEKVTSLPGKWKVSCNEIGSVILKTMGKIGSVKCEVPFEWFYVEKILKAKNDMKLHFCGLCKVFLHCFNKKNTGNLDGWKIAILQCWEHGGYFYSSDKYLKIQFWQAMVGILPLFLFYATVC